MMHSSVIQHHKTSGIRHSFPLGCNGPELEILQGHAADQTMAAWMEKL